MKSFSRILLGICATLFLMSLALFALAPTLLSTSWGTAAIAKVLSGQINGEIQIGNLDLSWWDSQKAEQINFKNRAGEPIISIGSLEAERSLFSLLGNPLKSGSLRLIDLKGTIVQDSQGVTNIEDFLGTKALSKTSLQTPVFLENVNLEAKKDTNGKIIVKAVGLTRQNDLKGQFSLNINLADKQTIQLNAQNFPVLVLDQTVSIQRPELSGTLLNLLGDSLDINVDHTGEGPQKSLQLFAKSPFVNSTIKAELLENTLKIYPESQVKFNLPLANTDRLRQIWAPQSPHPTQPLTGQLNIDSLELSLEKPSDLFGRLTLLIDENQWVFKEEKNPVNVKTLQVSVDATRASPELMLQVQGEGSQADKPLSLQFTIRVPKNAFLEGDRETLLEKGLSIQGNFQGDLLESNLTASVDGVLRNENSQIHLSLNSEKFALPEVDVTIVTFPWREILETGSCCTDLQGVLALKKPRMVGAYDQALASVEKITLPWSVNPNGSNFNFDFKAERLNDLPDEHLQGSVKINQWKQAEGIDLSKAAVQLHLKLHNFDLQTLQALLPHQDLAAAVNGNVNAEIAAMRDLKGNLQGTVNLAALNGQAFLKTLASTFTSENGHRDIQFQAKTKQAVGSTQVNGSLHNLFDENGKMRLDLASFTMQGQVKHFPVGLMVRIITGDKTLAEKAEAVLGSSVDADISADIRNKQGPVQLSVKGLNGQMQLNGKLQHGELLLAEPLTASLKVTPQLDKTVLREFIPILGYAMSSEKPIELTIAKEGFSIPLRSPSLSSISIGSATLNLNKIQFSRESQLGKVAALLGVNTNTFEVWFTPLNFSLQNGTLSVERTDMLVANNFPLASWGTVDFDNDKLQMAIALSGQALKKAFFIKNIKNSFMLVIPVKGAVNHPQIDTAQVTTRISSLVMQSRVPQGKVIGTIVDVATGLISSDTVPEPTTHPLPWAENEDETAESPIAPPLDDVIDEHLEELKKGAKSLIKGIFGK